MKDNDISELIKKAKERIHRNHRGVFKKEGYEIYDYLKSYIKIKGVDR